MIAVIDDEAAIVDGMRALLTEWGLTVIGAASGDEMLVALGDAGRYPDLIIADYRLACGERGTEVIGRLRHELGAPIPALLVSGDTSTEAIAAMRGRGLEVLSKPVLPQELKALAGRLLARRIMATGETEQGNALRDVA